MLSRFFLAWLVTPTLRDSCCSHFGRGVAILAFARTSFLVHSRCFFVLIYACPLIHLRCSSNALIIAAAAADHSSSPMPSGAPRTAQPGQPRGEVFQGSDLYKTWNYRKTNLYFSWFNLSNLVVPESRIMVLKRHCHFPLTLQIMNMKTFRFFLESEHLNLQVNSE